MAQVAAKKIITQTLKGLMIGILFIVILVIGLLAWIVAKPKAAWSIAERYILPKDMHITWEELQLHPEYLGDWSLALHAEVRGLVIRKAQPAINFPISLVRLHATLAPRATRRQVTIHELQILADKELFFQLPAKKEPVEEKNPFQTFQDIVKRSKKYLGYARIENIDIVIPEFTLAPASESTESTQLTEGGPRLNGSSDLDLRSPSGNGLNGRSRRRLRSPIQTPTQQQARALRFCLEAFMDSKTLPQILDYKFCFKKGLRPLLSVTTEGRLNLTKIEDNEFQLKGQLKIVGAGWRTSQKLSVDHVKNSTVLNLHGPFNYQHSKFHMAALPNLRLTMTPLEALVDLQSTFKDLPGRLVKVQKGSLQLRMPFDKDRVLSLRPSDVQMAVPVQIFFIDKDMRPPLTKACECKIPEMLMAKVQGQVWLTSFFQNSSRRHSVANLQFNFEDLQNKLLSLRAAGLLAIEKEHHQFLFSPKVDASAEIHSFQGLKNFLDARHVLIPAPFDVLEGTLALQIQGPIETSISGFTFPAVAVVKLKSKQQVVDLRAEAKMQLRRDFKSGELGVQALVNQLQLELPPLNPVQGKPRVVLDKRIIKQPPPPSKARSFQLAVAVDVATANPGAIRLLSSYFDPFLPLGVNLHWAGPNKNTGTIQAQSFNIRYLRRKVTAERMLVDLSRSGEKTFWVEGRFQVEQTQYTIFVDIEGPANQPQIILTSNPYLPRSEIISVLLFDRTSDQLASADAETAGNVEAAMVDRAIGLFSIWIFASTPIKGFSYSPSTKMYTATIEVSHDVTASIGTNWETATQVELRKRISRQWMLTASWSPAEEDQAENKKLVLQWERRF